MTLSRWGQRLGLAGALGCLLLAGSAWLGAVYVPRQRALSDEVGSQARHLRHDLQSQAELSSHTQSANAAQSAKADAIGTPEQAWHTLWRSLPSSEQRTRLQSAVLADAQAQGLLASAVQYRGAREAWSATEGAVLWRQRMVMPVEGSYPAVRAWLAQVLTEPALSVDELDIQRSDPLSDQVKARVAVSLWWRKPEGAHP